MSIATSSTSPPSRRRNGHPASPEYKRPNRTNVSAFKNAKNPHFKDTSFTVRNTTNVYASGNSPPDSLDKLYNRVAQNAILNAGGRADEVKCYPGTREEVIRLIERWRDGKDGASPSMIWLSGPAGAGKSAIVQTIAERWKESGLQVASFFFFRADRTRSTARPLVATLLYQIFKFCPPVRQAVATILSDDPLLFDTSIHDQFNQLLSLPLQDFGPSLKPPARRPIVLLIDGLDECDSDHKLSQRQILQALDQLVMRLDSPFLVLVASRAEPHITMAFKELSSPVQSIFLDDQFQPAKDIRTFVSSEFRRIKNSHHLAHTLSKDWPSEDDIESIVKKSSGQFIFAATVVRFIANSSASPKLSLERVQGIAPVATNSPFAQLDAIYTYIFSQADNREAVMDLLSMKLLRDHFRVSDVLLSDMLCAFYNPKYTPELLHSCVSDLAAILKFQGDKLVFYHASLPDFLTDKARAGEFHVKIYAFAVRILPTMWMKGSALTSLVDLGIELFSILKAPTPDITKALLKTPPSNWARTTTMMPPIGPVFRSIHKLYYHRDMRLYRNILRRWVRWYVRSAKMDLDLGAHSLPYMTFYIRISRMEYWVEKTLRSPFRSRINH